MRWPARDERFDLAGGDGATAGTMAPRQLRYDRMIDDAFRGVVRQALSDIAQHGLPGEHHFYIGFHTAHSGVDVPDTLKRQHPETMTIVLQHQFWGLEVDDRKFAVTLSFNNRNERLVVPFAAITEFTDPSVGFKLAFQLGPDDGATDDKGRNPIAPPRTDPPNRADDTAANKSQGARVVALDAFRKK
ncbi:MAG: SspB family protein [Dongiaceae bacterium]